MNSNSFILAKRSIVMAILIMMMVTAAAIGFSFNAANAKSPDKVYSAPNSHSEWIYVENGKVYYFESNGRLVYKQLKDADYRYNY